MRYRGVEDFVCRALWMDTIHSTVQAFDYTHTRVQNSHADPEPPCLHEQAECAATLAELRRTSPETHYRAWVAIRVWRAPAKLARQEHNRRCVAEGQRARCVQQDRTLRRWADAVDRQLEQILSDRHMLLRNVVGEGREGAA